MPELARRLAIELQCAPHHRHQIPKKTSARKGKEKRRGLLVIHHASCVTLSFSSDSLSLQIGDTKTLSLTPSDTLQAETVVSFTYQIGNDILYTEEKKLILPLKAVVIPANTSKSVQFNVTANKAGNVYLGINSSSEELEDLEDQFVKIEIVHNSVLVIVNSVIGWIYFAAWSISFYPQVFENWRRKSVIGLNFDFLAYNITGFVAYGVFNVGLYWIKSVQDQYFEEHPRGINPVQLNDVIFTLHAVFVTLITIFQCCIYDRGNQRISNVCKLLLTLAWLFIGVSLVLSLTKVITWLRYLQFFSYVKLGVTLIKYIPQAYMNYRRKSTLGWSIGNVLLDFTGGSFSLLQMFFLAYNSDDWSSLFGDPTKFGLGAFSILFDILFIVQHYCLYRKNQDYLLIREERDVLLNKESSNLSVSNTYN
ncbi:hypothetical protein FSP39_024973 [Pinctada imbricata]|uniref:Cystinosin n=1 Tax=Pinctada imbricata TaxID=66713 RepID=A0AA88Y442_PINIB|nr:hypothetical protein FSP39_024973 [Pinctada imbricata]